MNKSTLRFSSKLAVVVLCILGLIELGLALWTILDRQYRVLAYTLADVGYIDLWILRYLSLCLFASSIITLIMGLVLIWGLCSAHAFLFIASTMIAIIVITEFTISILTFTSKYGTRLTLIEQLPKLVITYRQGTDERANRALDILQSTFRCCGADGRLSYQNNVPLSCNMFSIGCLTRTIYFLDSSLDVLAYILIFFSLIKLFIVLFFYSFLCLYHRHRQNRSKNNDSSIRDHSSSFDSSSVEYVPKRTLIPSTMTDQDDNDDYGNEYEPSLSNRQTQYTTTVISPSSLYNNGSTIYYEKQHPSRKLSSISEKTEKTETDGSETDLSRLKYYKPRRGTITTTVHQNQYPLPLPKKLPPIKARRNIVRDDDNDNDSVPPTIPKNIVLYSLGVERSSSEKSFDENSIPKQHADTIDMTNKSKQTNNKPSSSLTFSKVFLTSVSDMQTIDDEVQKPLTTSTSDHYFSTKIISPRSILKKIKQIPTSYHHEKNLSSMYANTSPLLQTIPKPNPRSSLKQLKQEESLV